MIKLALIHPGQGSQYAAMGRKFYNSYGFVRDIINEASDTLSIDMKNLLFSGTMDELTHSGNAQPAIVTATYAIFSAYMHEVGLEPCCAAGHSLGEISALVCAGSIQFKDALLFTRKRGALMQQAFERKKGNLALVMGCPLEKLDPVIEAINKNSGYCTIACYNTPLQYLVAGEKESIKEVKREIKKLKAEFVPFSMVPMKVDAPFHSALMDFIEDDIKGELASLSFSGMKWNVYSNVTARPYNNENDIIENLTKQLTNPVKWTHILSAMVDEGVTHVIEIGPQYVLRQMVQDNTDKPAVFSYDVDSDAKSLRDSINLPEEKIESTLRRCLAFLASTPNNGRVPDEIFKRDVVETYTFIKELVEDRQFDRLHLTSSLDRVFKALKIKQTEESEYNDIAGSLITSSDQLNQELYDLAASHGVMERVVHGRK